MCVALGDARCGVLCQWDDVLRGNCREVARLGNVFMNVALICVRVTIVTVERR